MTILDVRAGQAPSGIPSISVRSDIALDSRFKAIFYLIPRDWWLNKAMTEVPRTWFRRDQVINLWLSRGQPRILSVAIAATDTDTNALQAPKLRAYSELPKMRKRIIDIARDLWSNENNIPPIVEEREIARFVPNTWIVGCRRKRRIVELSGAHSRPSLSRMIGSLGRRRRQSRRWVELG